MPAFDKRIGDFEAANTQVLGISTDSPFSHENWAKTVGISRYPLLSDVQRSVVKAYGVYWPDWNANVRATFILDKQGKVRFVERYGKGELPQPDKILAEVKKLGYTEAARGRVLRSERHSRGPSPVPSLPPHFFGAPRPCRRAGSP